MFGVIFIPASQLYCQGGMRTTLQKQKLTTALKQMHFAQNDTQERTGNHIRGSQPSISIINLDCSKREAHRRGRSCKKINPLATFSLPHANYHSKVFRFLVQNGTVREKSQVWATKLKSDRVRKVTLKNKDLQAQNVQKEGKLKVGRMGKGECKVWELSKLGRNLQKMNKTKLEDNLIESIKSFRKKQTSYTSLSDQITSEDAFITQNKLAKTSETVYLQKKASQLIENYERWKKEEAVYKLKLHIKNKLSRKHMYHALKQKQDVFNLIRSNLTEPALYQNSQGSSDLIRTVQTLPEEKSKSKTKSLENKKQKNYTLPIFQHGQQLKIESKPAQIICDILKCKEEYMRSSLIKMQKSLQLVDKNSDKIKIMNSFRRSPTKQEQRSVFWTNKAQSGSKNNPEKWNSPLSKEGRLLNSVKEVESQFRNLTPWRDNIDQ